MTLERSPLDALHRALGARIVEFGGWEMPLEYPTGTIAEHLACRRDAVGRCARGGTTTGKPGTRGLNRIGDRTSLSCGT